MGRVLEPFKQWFDDSGAPLALGWLRFLESGSNNTDKNTFADENLQIPNANPLQLDAAGRMPDVFGTGKYRVISFTNDPEDEDSPGEQIQVKDPVQAEASGAGGGQAGFEAWDNVTTYQLGDIVSYNNILYRSLIVDNLNNNPAIETYAWEIIDFLRTWNETITYGAGDLVYYSDNLYLSKAGSNINYQPDERYDFWQPVATGIKTVEYKTDDYEILVLERYYLFVLDAATTADKTFTLPLVSSSYDGFSVWIFNNSDYNLGVAPQGSASIWIEDPVTIQKGAVLGLRYVSYLDTWVATGNAGPILGAQDVGTIINPVENLYASSAHLVSELSLDDDIPLHFGADDDAGLLFTSATPALDLFLVTGVDFNINVNSVLHWSFDASGPILPGASNPLADIGSSSSYINDIYCNDINIDGQLYFNPANDLLITHSSIAGFITCYTGDLTITALAAGATLNLSTAGGTALSFDDALYATVYGEADFSDDIHFDDNINIYLGTGDDYRIFFDGTNAYHESTGTFRVRTGATPALAISVDTSQRTYFYNDVYMAFTDPRLYFESPYTWIGASTTGNTLYLVGEDVVAINVNSILMQINLISTGASGASTEAAYFRANIGGTNYYFKGYT